MESSIETGLFEKGSIIAGRYEVVSTLGKGGVGIVAQVIDRHLDNEICALKILFPHLAGDPTQFARFRNEVILSRRLSHPNIVRVYDFGSVGSGYHYITLEFVEGGSLSSRIYTQRYRPLPFSEKLRILYEILQGLGCAHRQGVIHRDLKPDNILLTDMDSVKVSDFGLARSTYIDKGFTDTGETVGTPYYMSPEQLRGKKVDARADLYSVGILAFELVVGRRPFYHDDYFALARMHVQDPLPKIATKESRIPDWFQQWLEKLTEKDRDYRFSSALEAADALAKYMNDEGNQSIKRIPAVLSLYTQRSFSPRKTTLKTLLPKVIVTGLFASIIFGSISLVRTSDSLKDKINPYIISSKSESSLGTLQTLFGSTATAGDVFQAVRLANEKLLSSLLAAGVDPNIKDGTGVPLLHYAVKTGNEKFVQMLIENGADTNIKSQAGDYALDLAAINGKVAVIDLLIDNGASVSSRDGELTPLMLAAKSGQVGAAERLLYRGAGATATDKQGKTALFYAIESRSRTLVQRLLELGVSPNAMDLEGNTPLIQAVKLHDEAMIRLIVGSGKVDVYAKNKQGLSAKDFATKNEQALLQSGVIMAVGEKSNDRMQKLNAIRGIPSASNASSAPTNVSKVSLKLGRAETKFETKPDGSRVLKLSVDVRNVDANSAKQVKVNAILKNGKALQLSGPAELGSYQLQKYTTEQSSIAEADIERLKVEAGCENCWD
jgi:serine/threonine protein kinase